MSIPGNIKNKGCHDIKCILLRRPFLLAYLPFLLISVLMALPNYSATNLIYKMQSTRTEFRATIPQFILLNYIGCEHHLVPGSTLMDFKSAVWIVLSQHRDDIVIVGEYHENCMLIEVFFEGEPIQPGSVFAQFIEEVLS